MGKYFSIDMKRTLVYDVELKQEGKALLINTCMPIGSSFFGRGGVLYIYTNNCQKVTGRLMIWLSG